jgi:aspartate racemase
MLTEVNEAIKARKLDRVGIIGTRTVMETRFYSGISTAEVIPPSGSTLDDVHPAYVAMGRRQAVDLPTVTNLYWPLPAVLPGISTATGISKFQH